MPTGLVRRVFGDPRLAWAVVGVPVAALVWTVTRHWVDVPVGDQWELPVDIRQIHTSGVDVSDLWRQHNEHRIVFPRIAMLLLAWPTKFDSRAQMTLSLALAFVALVLTLLLLRRTLADLPRPAVLTTATVTAVILFSPMQYENWLWGFQISWFMNTLGVVMATGALTLWPVGRRPIEPVLVAIAGVLLAQYSLANGTMAWICLAPLLMIGRRYRRLLPLWGGTAVVSTTAYFIGYHKPPGHPPLTEILHHPVEGVRYVALFLGRTVFDNHDVGVAFGLFLLLSFTALGIVVARQRQESWPLAAPWVCIGAYVVCSALSAATGRAGFGIDQAAASRYTTIALLFLVATLVLATLVLRERALTAVLPWCVVAAMFLADYPEQNRRMSDLETVRQTARQCLLTVTSVRDPCLKRLYPRPFQVYPRIEFLRELGWLPEPIRSERGTPPG